MILPVIALWLIGLSLIVIMNSRICKGHSSFKLDGEHFYLIIKGIVFTPRLVH